MSERGTSATLVDVHARADTREVRIQQVGVEEVVMPLLIKDKGGGMQPVQATISASVGLPQHYRGTHMSRFLEILELWGDKPLSIISMRAILADILHKLQAQDARLVVRFQYFMKKRAPVSGVESHMGYHCAFHAHLDGANLQYALEVQAPVTTVCPCSKEISRYGAHNQRAAVVATVRFKPRTFIWIEDLVTMLEAEGSAEVYAILKRQDEKEVTERGYENPKFVEDVLRDVAVKMRRDPRIVWFSVKCSSQESIHNHVAFAQHEEHVGTPSA